MTDLELIFRSADPRRDKFLSRLFGIFSEEVVRIWSSSPDAAYQDLGRPTVFEAGESRGSTLDFALRARATGEVFVSEMKCELEYESYRYLRLREPWQLDHHRAPAFRRFLELSRTSTVHEVRVAGKHLDVSGGILVWGSVTPGGREAVMQHYRLADVLSVEAMLADLRRWGPATAWPRRLAEWRDWSAYLFEHLRYLDV